MKNIVCFLFSFLIFFTAANAQFKITVVVSEQTFIHHDSIYITGNFRNWDSLPDPKYLMKPAGMNKKSIVLTVPAGELRYKFLRGSWFTVEKHFAGDEVNDHVVQVKKDTTLKETVNAWRDEIIKDKQFALAENGEDTKRVRLLAAIADIYGFFPEFYNADSALLYAQQALQLLQTISSSRKYSADVQKEQLSLFINLRDVIATLLHSFGNYSKALEIRLQNINAAEQTADKSILAQTILSIAPEYFSMKDYRNVLYYGKLADSVINRPGYNSNNLNEDRWNSNYRIAEGFYNLKMTDSALYYAKKLATIKVTSGWSGPLAFSYLLMADIYSASGELALAASYLRSIYPLALRDNAYNIIAFTNFGMAKLFQKQQRPDSALIYAKNALAFFQSNKLTVRSWGENTDNNIAEISPVIAELYSAMHQPDSAYKYLRLSVTIKDSLYNADKIRQFQNLSFNEIDRRRQAYEKEKQARLQFETRIKIFGLITGLLVFIALAIIFYRNNKQKQKANIVLQSQKKEIENTLAELKNTQKQLIQSEKMASLGELTAGIAHEIQNPLNFVNNFSEVSNELIDEMNEEMGKGNNEEARIIANELKQNLEKINHHGKRADAIVKGMLQHSRINSGQKQLTDINALCDEYLRLAFHGLRAKDKDFNADLKTDFDETIEKVNIIPQDIGRVLLNLYNNAFYVVSERKKLLADNYEPLVSVTTKSIISPSGDRGVEIKVADNGSGIPQNIVDKIFQPFFTTKPTGQGTGLGLSLSYDIIKAHGGEIKVETKVDEGNPDNFGQGEGTQFIIHLPVN